MLVLPKISDSTPAAEAFKARRAQLMAEAGKVDAQEFIKVHAAAVDDYFLASFTQSAVGPRMGIMRNPYALVALGGYGRAEQCVFSDIDLLFLFENKVPAEAEALVREIVYPLWDLGLEVGHTVRSIKDCVVLARQDLEVLTSILDGRFICGISPLYHQLMERMRAKVIGVNPAQVITQLIEANDKRHARFGESAYLLEPNLKEGQGGLRDYHTMLWIARILSDIKQARDLEYYGYLSHEEYQTLCQSLGFVWSVRNQLHLLMGRKCDQLHLEYQTRLAEAMAIPEEEGQLPVERLLGDLHGRMEYIKQCYGVYIHELEQRKRMKRKNKALKETQVPGLKFNRGMLNFVSPEAILQQPALLAQIFAESANHKAPLSAEARRLIRGFKDVIGRPDFRSQPEVVEAFERVLARPGAESNALDAMLDTGFLLEFIPQFKQVVNRIQFDQYHLYPVARHLLLAVQILKAVGSGKIEDPLGHSLYQDLRSKRALLWATLLHDIGKAEATGGHAARGALMAAEICREKGLSAADIEIVQFLVDEHLLLFETATRRDINDEQTALNFAGRVGKAERLKMLYLLSVADARATGPKAWNDWTGSLMRTLFLKTLNVIEKGELVTKKALRTIEEKKERIIEKALTREDRESNASLVDVLAPRYLLYTPSQEIAQHLDLYRQLQERPFVWRIAKATDGVTRTITLCAKDRPGLLSRIAGVLTLNNIDILDVRIFTWRNNIALDIFEVKAPVDLFFEEERWQRAARNLNEALGDQLDLSKELAVKLDGFRTIQAKAMTKNRPQKVVIDNETSSFFTIIEVVAWDFPGLLYRVTDALFRCRLDIWVAKIATRVDQVVDVFYVRNFDGEKVDRDEEVATIRKTVEEVLL
ncbi:MAG: [protein-PII] uridylyltransferase [Desulfobacteraceae bacterium]|nr:[protein-PII] uridylyltransferase [Desulfobacteraceae bacterium]